MKLPFHLKPWSAVAVCAAGGVAAPVAAAAAVLYVNVDRLDVVDKKRTVAKTVVTVDRNAQLTVIAKEGRWYKVDVGGKQGYVAETVVSDKPQGKKGQTVALSSINDGAAPAIESAAAVRGVGPGAAQYASGKGYRTDGLLLLQKRRDAVSPTEFDRFVAEGGLVGTAALTDPATGDTNPVATARAK